MSCEEFQTLAGELARTGQASLTESVPAQADERDSALAHVAECSSCGSEWEAQRSLSGGLRKLAEEMKEISAPVQLEVKLLEAFREHNRVTPTVRAFPVPQRQTHYWWAAAAAALLIVVGIVAVRGRLIGNPKPQDIAKQTEATGERSKTQASMIEEPVKAIDKFATEVASPVHVPSRKTRNAGATIRRPLSAAAEAVAVAANEGQSYEATKEVATDFFPIGYATAPNLQDGGQLVRVELPRSAVARFGLPINMDRTSERVKADVLIGVDGLAQAIRFVH